MSLDSFMPFMSFLSGLLEILHSSGFQEVSVASVASVVVLALDVAVAGDACRGHRKPACPRSDPRSSALVRGHPAFDFDLVRVVVGDQGWITGLESCLALRALRGRSWIERATAD